MSELNSTQVTHRMKDIISEQVRSYFSNSSLNIQMIENKEETLFLNRMALILVANSDFRLLIKVHCNECDIKSLAKEALQFSDVDLNTGLIDFIKELTNLLGGALKRSLESANLQIGLSLPLMIRGFDELFSEASSQSEVTVFSLGTPSQRILVQVQIDYLTEKSKETLEQVNFSSASDAGGGFEFL